MKTIVIIPTYNEKENIQELTTEIFNLKQNISVLVVDDNSPDGTSSIIQNMQKNFLSLFLITRSGKLGLGTAYKTGFEFALINNFELIMTMDADFSHHPKYIPQILNKAQQCDIVIGSRYVPNGGVLNWPLWRILLSKSANTIAKIFLRLKAKDCTAGFRCYSAQVLQKINLQKIKSSGYSFLIEMLYHCQQQNFKVGEVPIIFEDRKKGTSKISKNEIFKAIATIIRLKFAF